MVECTTGYADWNASGTGADRLRSPSAARNRDPILEVLQSIVAGSGPGTILEFGSGTGEHAVHFAAALPEYVWQPSDCVDHHLPSIAAWIAHYGNEAPGRALPRSPILLDATEADWNLPDDLPPLVAMVSINVVHIAPWSVAEGLVAGAAARLSGDGILYFYGPFKRGGIHTAPGNAAFDASLRMQDPAWGVRDLDELSGLALRHGFDEPELVEMPANNLSVIFRRQPAG